MPLKDDWEAGDEYGPSDFNATAAAVNANALPPQTGQSGKFLGTNGSEVAWGSVAAATATRVSVKEHGAIGDGDTDDTAAIGAATAAALAADMPLYFPPGTYNVTAAIDWMVENLVVEGAGMQNVKIVQYTADTPIVLLAGGYQNIGGFTLVYDVLPDVADVGAVGIMFGDDTVGDAAFSRYHDILIEQSNTGMGINPDLTAAAGIFSCLIENVRINGYSNIGMNLESGGSTGAGGGCTGSVFNNIYLSNNYPGTVQASADSAIRIKQFNECVFNQINIEWTAPTDSDVISVSTSGPIVFTGLHYEGVELSGDGAALMLINGSQVVINGGMVMGSEFTGATSNPVFRFYDEDNTLTVVGWRENDLTVTTPDRPLIDWGSAINSQAWLQGASTVYNSGDAVGGDSTDEAEINVIASAAVSAATPILFSAATAIVGVSPTDRAPFARTLTGARMRTAAAAAGSDLVAQVQSFGGSSWDTIGTLTIPAGSIIEDTTTFSEDQITGDLLRVNVTSVGSTTAASGVIIEVAWSY